MKEGEEEEDQNIDDIMWFKSFHTARQKWIISFNIFHFSINEYGYQKQ